MEQIPLGNGKQTKLQKETNPEGFSKQIQRLGKSQKYAIKLGICDDWNQTVISLSVSYLSVLKLPSGKFPKWSA